MSVTLMRSITRFLDR